MSAVGVEPTADAPIVRAVCRVLKETVADLAIAVADALEEAGR